MYEVVLFFIKNVLKINHKTGVADKKRKWCQRPL